MFDQKVLREAKRVTKKRWKKFHSERGNFGTKKRVLKTESTPRMKVALSLLSPHSLSLSHSLTHSQFFSSLNSLKKIYLSCEIKEWCPSHFVFRLENKKMLVCVCMYVCMCVSVYVRIYFVVVVDMRYYSLYFRLSQLKQFSLFNLSSNEVLGRNNRFIRLENNSFITPTVTFFYISFPFFHHIYIYMMIYIHTYIMKFSWNVYVYLTILLRPWFKFNHNSYVAVSITIIFAGKVFQMKYFSIVFRMKYFSNPFSDFSILLSCSIHQIMIEFHPLSIPLPSFDIFLINWYLSDCPH